MTQAAVKDALRVLEGLRVIAEQCRLYGEPTGTSNLRFTQKLGICHNFNRNVDPDLHHAVGGLKDAFYDMGLDPTYPVPPPAGYATAEAAYEGVSDKWTGEYGAARVALLDDLILYYREVLSESRSD